MKPVLRGHPGWVDWGEHKSWASHLRAGAQQSEASWEVWGTFSVFSFLCPLGPMIFLREGGNSPCHAEVGGSHLLYGPRQEQGEKIFSMAGLKLQAFWVIMRPLIRADNTNIQQIRHIQIKALVFLNSAIRNSKGKNTFTPLWMFEKLAICLGEQFLLL